MNGGVVVTFATLGPSVVAVKRSAKKGTPEAIERVHQILRQGTRSVTDFGEVRKGFSRGRRMCCGPCPLAKGEQRCLIESVVAVLSLFPHDNQSHLAQHLQVFGHCRLSHSQCLHQLAHTHFTMVILGGTEQLNNVAPGGISEGIKDVGHNSVAYKDLLGSTMASGHR